MKKINKTFLAFWLGYTIAMGALIGFSAHVAYAHYQKFLKVATKMVTNENP